MRVKTTLINEMLGTASADRELHEKFIASKSADKNKIKEELESLSAAELIEKALTVHYRDDDGDPMIWDYMVRGVLKSALGAMVEFKALTFQHTKTKISKWNYKRFIDNHVFVYPRKIKLQFEGDSKKLETITRPLRAETMKGDRVALATSEIVPAGAVCEFEIKILEEILEPVIRKCLDYGQLKGFGQWRNASCGAFTWEEIE